MNSSPKYSPVGDRALLAKFGDTIDLKINLEVHAFSRAIAKASVNGFLEGVPAYASLLVYYDPVKTSYERLVFTLKDLETKISEDDIETKPRTIVVPTVYGGMFGPDLAGVAEYHKLSEKEVVRLHSQKEYVVYMIGFIAGFPYMGTVPNAIATPRLETPRIKIASGSVGIAGNQTGIYPREAPGGWRIIGRTHLRLFNPDWEDQPALFQPGDRVRFQPISEEEHEVLRKKP